MEKITGLTSEEVQQRIASGDVNVDANVHTRSVKEILFDNLVTLFNAVNLILAVIVFLTGSYKNMLFMIVIVVNVFIGIIQELRSKAVTDKLSIVASAHACEEEFLYRNRGGNGGIGNYHRARVQVPELRRGRVRGGA